MKELVYVPVVKHEEFLMALEEKFNLLTVLLKHYAVKKNQSGFEETAYCICDFIENQMNPDQTRKIIEVTDQIGYENIRKAFSMLTRECEHAFQETENLFKIVKIRRLNQGPVKNHIEMLKRIGQYLYLTMMYLNKSGNTPGLKMDPELIGKKRLALDTISPLITQVSNVLNKKINNGSM